MIADHDLAEQPRTGADAEMRPSPGTPTLGKPSVA
jgi:hypothetical protein